MASLRSSATAAAIGVYGSSKQNDFTYPRPSPYLRPQSGDKTKKSQSTGEAKKAENSMGYTGNSRPAYNIVSGDSPKVSNNKSSNRPSSAGPTNRVRPTTYVPPAEYTTSSSKPLSWMSAGIAAEKPNSPTSTTKQATVATSYQTASSTGYARPKSAGPIRPSQKHQAPAALSSQNPVNEKGPEKRLYTSSSGDKIDKPPENSRRSFSDGKIIDQDVVQLQKDIAAAASRTRTSGIQPSGYQPPKEHWATSYRVHYGSGPGSTPAAVSNANGMSTTSAGVTYQLDNAVSSPTSTLPSKVAGTGIASVGALGTTANAAAAAATDGRQGPSGSGLPPKHVPIAASRMQAAIAHSNKVGAGIGSRVASASASPPVMGLSAADTDREVGVDTDDDDCELGDPMEGGIDVEEDDGEMDGKRVSDSRSHPEVTTPSQSLEFDIRGNSSTSIGHVPAMTCGLSTLPNEYCSANEAQELKKQLFSSIRMSLTPGMASTNSNAMDMYMVGKVVGVGSYGKVRAAWHRLSGAKVAIKTYDKTKMKDPAHWKRVQSEIAIMEEVSHPRIARMFEAVETTKRVHIIMECIDGGNLCSYVKAKRRLTEEESRRIFFQLLQAMDYLHNLNFIHRDIKLENVLFGEGKDIKLIDFGFSTVHQQGKRHRVFCGTPSYMAPEIVKRLEYEGKPTDMWSMGILLYALLCGCFPFRARTYPDLYRRIARGYFSVPDELSPAVKDLLQQLLTLDPHSRATASRALSHPWLQTQLTSAPDISRLRSENPILISLKPLDDLNDQVLAEMQLFGISREEIIRQISNKIHTPITTLYYLLRKNVINTKKITTISSGSGSGGRIAMVQKHTPIGKRDSAAVTGAYALANSHLPTASPASPTSPTYHDASRIPQTMQGVLGGTRPRSASGGRSAGGVASRPRSATATRQGGRG